MQVMQFLHLQHLAVWQIVGASRSSCSSSSLYSSAMSVYCVGLVVCWDSMVVAVSRLVTRFHDVFALVSQSFVFL